MLDLPPVFHMTTFSFQFLIVILTCNWTWCLPSNLKLTHAPFIFEVLFKLLDLILPLEILSDAIIMIMIVPEYFSFLKIHTQLFLSVHFILV